jgi:site-specific DNA-methyltransferase (adenine-specific)
MSNVKSGSQPDILEVIADLSNDEVFTPPRLANQVLDLLPAEVWTNPNLRFLDPGAKTGVFLREVTRRLMDGLSDAIPDEGERLEHILKVMVWGIAITELTSLMARRTLYCSKDATSEHSAVTFQNSSGNVWFNKVEHSFVNGRCKECSAPKDLEREGRDNYAYAFIHQQGRTQLEKELPVKFDVIIGNPPYQMDGGAGGTSASPLYNVFVEQAKSLNPDYLAMIIPSRWMAGGRGLEDFRENMLNDSKVSHLVDYPNTKDVFPGVEIKGGVCYFLWSSNHKGPAQMTIVRGEEKFGPVSRDLSEFDVLVRDGRALDILHIVQGKGESTIETMISGNTPFGLATNFKGYSKSATKANDEIKIYLFGEGKRSEGFAPDSVVQKNRALIGEWKVLLPAAYGAGETVPHQILGQSIISEPKSACTQTYLTFGPFTNRKQAENAQRYLNTRVARFLVSLRKISQDAQASVYSWVPAQDWDIEWSDDLLTKKYGLSADHWNYIQSMVKEMPA